MSEKTWRCGDCHAEWSTSVTRCRRPFDDRLAVSGGSVDVAIMRAALRAIQPLVQQAERRLAEYRCDGMPSMFGCPADVTVTRRWSRPGTKKSGWLVIHGQDDDGTDDLDVVLTFCPRCAEGRASAGSQPHDS